MQNLTNYLRQLLVSENDKPKYFYNKTRIRLIKSRDSSSNSEKARTRAAEINNNLTINC